MISIDLDKPSYSPGDTVSAKITLGWNKPVKARSLVATLSCVEAHRTTEQRIMDKYDFDREKEMGGFKETHMYTATSEHREVVFEEKKTLLGEGEVQRCELSVSFSIPKSGPPTSHEFGHDGKIHIWKLHVKLDIPLALDHHAEKEIFVEGL